jgi:hypothetical protein
MHSCWQYCESSPSVSVSLSDSPVLDDSLELAVVGCVAALVSEPDSLLEPDESSLDESSLDDSPLDDPSLDDPPLDDSLDDELDPLESTIDPLDSVVGDGSPEDDPSDDDDEAPFVPASVSSPPHAHASTHQTNPKTPRRILASISAPPRDTAPARLRNTMDAAPPIHQGDPRRPPEFARPSRWAKCPSAAAPSYRGVNRRSGRRMRSVASR